MFTATIAAFKVDPKGTHHQRALLSTSDSPQAWRAIKKATDTASPLEKQKGDRYRCCLLEDGIEALWAFGDTPEEAAQTAKAMHSKAARGGGR